MKDTYFHDTWILSGILTKHSQPFLKSACLLLARKAFVGTAAAIHISQTFQNTGQGAKENS